MKIQNPNNLQNIDRIGEWFYLKSKVYLYSNDRVSLNSK